MKVLVCEYHGHPTAVEKVEEGEYVYRYSDAFEIEDDADEVYVIYCIYDDGNTFEDEECLHQILGVVTDFKTAKEVVESLWDIANGKRDNAPISLNDKKVYLKGLGYFAQIRSIDLSYKKVLRREEES